VAEGRRRIFAAPGTQWDGRWCLVTLSVPEARRELRDRMRKALTWLGFGSPSSALYVSPRDYRDEVVSQAEQLGARAYVQVFRAETDFPADPRELVERAWPDLAELDRRYAEFVDRFGADFQRQRLLANPNRLEPGAAFRTRIALVNQLRGLLFGDPELPADLLPPGWHGLIARDLFLDYHALVTAPALACFDRLARES
jgi:phenylacetic acid degradation operon negative regulatory protein